jgi:transcriptional regulator with XRE-family HTH domain
MSSLEDARRLELADFLKSRRSQIQPQSVGLPSGQRRRVQGLRREEVAELAEISPTWYTWMEQGRPVTISPRTVSRLGEALQLNSAETEHLKMLAGHSIAAPETGQVQVPPSLLSVIDQMGHFPCYVVCPRWCLMAWNPAAEAVFGPFQERPELERNLLWLTFTEPSYRKLFTEWERFARCMINHFRADFHGGLGTPEGAALVDKLLRLDPSFRKWWSEHEVTRPPNWRKNLMHPKLGLLSLDQANMQISDSNYLRLTVYTPANAATERSLRSISQQPAIAAL